MRKIGMFILTALIAFAFSGCGAPAGNSNSNGSTGNANSGKTTAAAAAAPTADSLLALDKQANEAYFKGDSKFFEGFLSEKFAEVRGGTRFDKAAVLKIFGDTKCEMKSWALDEPKMTMVDADTYVFSYKGTFDGSCTVGGKTEKVRSPIRAATVFVRNGDKWQAAFHGENPIVDPKAPPAAPAKPDAKEEPKKDEANPAEKSASNLSSAPGKSPNTDALVALEKSGWTAWKMKDAKRLEELTGKNLAILGPDGSWMTRAETLKFWVEMPCENVKTVEVKEGYAVALSKDVEMMTFKGSADGTCFGQKNGTQDSMSVYVKEDGVWKLAFNFSAAM